MLFMSILPVNLAISALRAAADVEGSMAMVVGKRERVVGFCLFNFSSIQAAD